MSSEKRLIIALVLTMAILLVYETFVFGPQQEAKRKELAEKAEIEKVQETEKPENPQARIEAAETPKSDIPASPAEIAQVREPPAINEQIPEETVVVNTSLWDAVLSNKGAFLKSFQLKDYFQPDNKSLKRELINWKKIPLAPLSASYGDVVLPDAMYRIERRSPLEIAFRAQTNGFTVEKLFKFQEDAYHFDLETTLKSNIEKEITGDFDLWFSYYQGEAKEEGGWFSPQVFVPQVMCFNQADGLEAVAYDDIEPDGKIKTSPLWAGISEQYFISALIPPIDKLTGSALDCQYFKGDSRHLLSALSWRGVTLKPSESKKFEATVFLGPKKVELMKKLGSELEFSVDWGWLGAICRPMLWLLNFLFSIFGNWGIAIIFLTIIVKILMYPVTHKSMKSMREMQNLKPEMDKLKEKFGDDKTKLNQEMMQLYRSHGVNPLGGCLPLFLQMPIWFALYRTLYTAVDLYQANFIPGWIDDLAAADPFYIFPVGLGVITFVQQAITPTTMDNAQAKMMKWFMPPFFTVIMLGLPSGLTLYIFVNSILSIFQQMIINKAIPANTAIAKNNPQKTDGGKKSERKGK